MCVKLCEIFEPWLRELLTYVVGYICSVVGGSIAINFVMKPLWGTVKSEGVKEKITQPYPRIVGWIERFLYTTALLSAYPSFIGVWLTFKVVGRWERAKKQFEVLYEKNSEDIMSRNKMKAHAIYNVFIIGNGLSIAYAVMGYKIIDWMHRGQNLQLSPIETSLQWYKVLSILFFAIIATLILWKCTKDLFREMIKCDEATDSRMMGKR